MSENSSFFARNKVAIAATVAVAVSAVSAYLILRNLDSNGASETSSKKKSKKKKKKTSSSAGAAATPASYPVDAEGLPALTEEFINKLTEEEKSSISVELKEQGNNYFKDKEFEKAIKFYTAALQLKEDAIYYSNRSACYVGLGDFNKVVEDTTLALKLNPEHTKSLLRRSNAYEELGDYENAMYDLTCLTIYGGFNESSIEKILDRVLKKQSYKIVEKKLETYKLSLPSPSIISSFFGAFSEDNEELNKLSSIEGLTEESNAGDYNLLQGLKQMELKTSEGYDAADSYFDKAIKFYESKDLSSVNKENFSIALEYFGAFKFLKNDPMSALELLSKSIELEPRPKSFIFSALINADKQEFEAAYKDFENGIKLNPDSSEIYYHRAQMYYLTNELAKAEKDFLKSKELNPENVYSYIQLACILYREGKFEESKQAFIDAKKKFPTSPEIPNYYGEILSDHGDFDLAIKQFEISAKLQDSLNKVSVGVLPLINKATLLSKTPTPENISSAIELLETAINKDPKSETAKAALAQLKLQDQKVEEAIKLFEEASDLARNLDEKLQATGFAEASKIQLRVKQDPILSKKVNQLLSQYGIQQ